MKEFGKIAAKSIGQRPSRHFLFVLCRRGNCACRVAGPVATAFLHGAIPGLAAYGTYDVTNLAAGHFHGPCRDDLRHLADGADRRRRMSRRQKFRLNRDFGMKDRVPIMNIGASRLGTKFELVKIVILSLTNVQNIHVTLIGIDIRLIVIDRRSSSRPACYD
nr:DUF2177 family protein [Rhizobium sp. CIAT894]